jgi:hypothetical protein
VFENKVLRKMFGLKRDGIIEDVKTAVGGTSGLILFAKYN